MSTQPEKLSDVKMDMANLYREEAYTDLKTGGIRKLVPVKLDGSEDASREPIFSGHTQLMGPHGPLPLQGGIDAKTLEEAVLKFPQAMEDAMTRMIEEAQQYQREQANKIITPADLKKEGGLII
ncbi:MAG: cytoplasmic protein [Verrucomicrobia bacterium]|nr:cytoplasmic protein [Verrucomicrobiota bacterium]